MLYDVRTYTCRPGTTKKHLALYAEHGYEIQSRHLGKPLAYLQTESGNINSYMHIWVYESARQAENFQGLETRLIKLTSPEAQIGQGNQ